MASPAQHGSATRWQDREYRTTNILLAEMKGERTPNQRIVIRNVSARGLGARAQQQPPALGESVIVISDKLGELGGVVKWVRGDRFGLHLAVPLKANEIDRLGSEWSEARPGFAVWSN